MINMAYKISVTLFFLIATLCCSAQDTMYMMNGDTMNVKVTEVSATEVRYKLQSNPNGPDYVVSKTKIFMVEYENGSKDLFARGNATIEEPMLKQRPIAEPANAAKRAELKRTYRGQLGGGIAAAAIGTLGTAIVGSMLVTVLTDEVPNSDQVGTSIGYGFITLVSATILTIGIRGIVRSGTVKRELNALPVAITPVIIVPRTLQGIGPEQGTSYGINLAFQF